MSARRKGRARRSRGYAHGCKQPSPTNREPERSPREDLGTVKQCFNSWTSARAPTRAGLPRSCATAAARPSSGSAASAPTCAPPRPRHWMPGRRGPGGASCASTTPATASRAGASRSAPSRAGSRTRSRSCAPMCRTGRSSSARPWAAGWRSSSPGPCAGPAGVRRQGWC
jgi:hypothetical protein